MVTTKELPRTTDSLLVVMVMGFDSTVKVTALELLSRLYQGMAVIHFATAV
jgi:hypothetical protein